MAVFIRQEMPGDVEAIRTVVGSAFAHVDAPGEVPVAVGLGPLAVQPDRQGRGVGRALMHAVLGAADSQGELLVALLGEPRYYARFGFRPASEHGITAPDPQWGRYFQVRSLSAYRPVKGVFAYAEPFSRL